MRVPKYIAAALIRRANAAQSFLSNDRIVSEWIESHGFIDEIEPEDIMTGCESLCNPYSSSQRVLEVIENHEEDDKT